MRYTSHHASGISGYSRYWIHAWSNSAPPTSGMSAGTGIRSVPVAVDLRVDLGVEERGEADGEHVERQPDDELVGAEAVAMFACTKATTSPPSDAEEQGDPDVAG